MSVLPITDLRLWSFPPDWSQPVTEALSWGTNVTHASATAVSEHVGYQLGPQRSLSFEVSCMRRGERQIIDMLLSGWRGGWLLPIWPDVQWLAGALDAGDETIACRTEGFDFVVGGYALVSASLRRYEVVEIALIGLEGITLAAPLVESWPVGTRLYPLRRARIQDGAEERLLSDRASRRKLAFDLDEPCDWPALADPTLYLTHPVLDVRPDESDNPTASYDRLRQSLQYPGTLAFSYDPADQSLRTQSTHWKLFGRMQHSWFRSMLYTLAGRSMPMWLPSFADDITPADAIAGGSTSMSVQWAGYTKYGNGRHNRRDLRIELVDGTVLYRRITNAAEAGVAETLTLATALDGGSIAPDRIRQISFMALSTLASDSAEIAHVTDADGLGTATLGWQAVVPDV